MKVMMNKKNNHPTHLWISNHATLISSMISYLQQKLCTIGGCTNCITCQQIVQKDHPWIIWIQPERSYTLEMIDEILEHSRLQLDNHEQRFIIFDQAERLTEQCANRLLKTIEEPSAGYSFFFLTNRAQALPKTIQSRCLMTQFKTTQHSDMYQEFLIPFRSLTFDQPIQSIKLIDSLDIKEQETKDLVDQLYDYWSQQLKEALVEQLDLAKLYNRIIILLQDALQNPPSNGSAKIFWKNLYLKMHYAATIE